MINKDKNRRSASQPDRIVTWDVPETTTLLAFVEKRLADHSKTKVKSMLKHNQFAVNSMPTSQFDTPLEDGDKVSVNFTKSFRVFSSPRIKLVYEDNDILVINKGYGVLSMGTDNIKEGTAYSIMREYVKYSDPRAKVFIVHRLDRDTSGLMMLAKTMEAKDTMQHNWNNMVLNRKYVAVVEGVIPDDEGVVKSYLAETAQFEVYSTQDPTKGQLAITRYKVLKRSSGYTLVELELDTGRKNQIRVHMKHIRHPLPGDFLYNPDYHVINRQALHSFRLAFQHPITRETMDFTAPIPDDMRTILK